MSPGKSVTITWLVTLQICDQNYQSSKWNLCSWFWLRTLNLKFMLTGTAAHLLLYTYLNQLRRHGILKYICLPYNFYIMAWYYVSTQPRVPSLRSIFQLYPLVPLQVHFLCYLLCCRPGIVIMAVCIVFHNVQFQVMLQDRWDVMIILVSPEPFLYFYDTCTMQQDFVWCNFYGAFLFFQYIATHWLHVFQA